MTKHVITTIRHLLESDEGLKRLVRSGLFDALERNQDDPRAWQKAIAALKRHGALLTFTSPTQPLFFSEKQETFVVRSVRLNKQLSWKTPEWVISFSSIKNTSLRLNWPFKNVARIWSEPDIVPGKGPLRQIKFNYILKSEA